MKMSSKNNDGYSKENFPRVEDVAFDMIRQAGYIRTCELKPKRLVDIVINYEEEKFSFTSTLLHLL